MSRIKIDLPELFDFDTEVRVSINDINAGGHLGNHSLVAILNEAHLRFLEAKGFPEPVIDGLAFINSDLAIVYRSQAFHRDVLRIEVAVANFHKYGCDIVYRVTNNQTGKQVAVAKTGMLFFDYQRNKIAEVPARFKSVFESS
ncbi:MAG TPA: thioesterase family protein [Dehalococcoidia bacterium]|nr:thioesterase family protein [Dehalococcoidia bacterium]